MWIYHATGRHHPDQRVPGDFDILEGGYHTESARSRLGHPPNWRLPRQDRRESSLLLMAPGRSS